MIRAMLLLTVALPVLGQAAPVKRYHATMTGETLARYYLGYAEPRPDSLKGGDLVNREMARGYMDGIKDTTEGTAWCYTGGKPHTLNADIADAISKLSPLDQKAPAGPLVVSTLRKLYPCPSDRRPQ